MNSSKESEQDKLKLEIKVDEETNHIILDFGKPIKWISLRPDTALQLAKTLERHVVLLKLKHKVENGEDINVGDVSDGD